ncbi:MAG: hypothetical protein ACK40H_04340, partial [Sphingomonadaceae bacterium]
SGPRSPVVAGCPSPLTLAAGGSPQMRLQIALLCSTLPFAAGSALAQGTTHVRGHVRSDGTYVAPHYRTLPDGSRLNNWSTYPNVNPYTGRQGTVDPYGFSRPPRQGFGQGGQHPARRPN